LDKNKTSLVKTVPVMFAKNQVIHRILVSRNQLSEYQYIYLDLWNTSSVNRLEIFKMSRHPPQSISFALRSNRFVLLTRFEHCISMCVCNMHVIHRHFHIIMLDFLEYSYYSPSFCVLLVLTFFGTSKPVYYAVFLIGAKY